MKARESVFWPGISDDIWETVEKCGICQSTSRASKHVGNISEVPPHPWHTLGTDLLYWNRLYFFVVGEYFTKFLIIGKLPNSSTHVVIKELGMIFTELDDHSYLGVTMGHVIVLGNFSSSLNSTRFTIPQAAHTIHEAIDLLKLWWTIQRN